MVSISLSHSVVGGTDHPKQDAASYTELPKASDGCVREFRWLRSGDGRQDNAIWIEVFATGEYKAVFASRVQDEWSEPKVLASQTTKIQIADFQCSHNGSRGVAIWKETQWVNEIKTKALFASFYQEGEFSPPVAISDRDIVVKAASIALSEDGKSGMAVWAQRAVASKLQRVCFAKFKENTFEPHQALTAPEVHSHASQVISVGDSFVICWLECPSLSEDDQLAAILKRAAVIDGVCSQLDFHEVKDSERKGVADFFLRGNREWAVLALLERMPDGDFGVYMRSWDKADQACSRIFGPYATLKKDGTGDWMLDVNAYKKVAMLRWTGAPDENNASSKDLQYFVISRGGQWEGPAKIASNGWQCAGIKQVDSKEDGSFKIYGSIANSAHGGQEPHAKFTVKIAE